VYMPVNTDGKPHVSTSSVIVPLVRTPQLLPRPPAICRNSPEGALVSPKSSGPQQVTVPSLRMAQRPDTCWKLPEGRPTSSPPQQTRVPSVRMPQALSVLEICARTPGGGADCPQALSPQH
jgi:hypothetical protein